MVSSGSIPGVAIVLPFFRGERQQNGGLLLHARRVEGRVVGVAQAHVGCPREPVEARGPGHGRLIARDILDVLVEERAVVLHFIISAVGLDERGGQGVVVALALGRLDVRVPAPGEALRELIPYFRGQRVATI